MRSFSLALTLLLSGLSASAGGGPSHPPTLVLQGGSLFDTLTGEMRPVGAITIMGDRIVSVTGPNEPGAITAGARVIDARGKFLIPGLIDAHVHLVHILRNLQMTGDEMFPLFLASGVTTLRDVGDEVVAEKLLQKLAEEHQDSAPRVFMGSFLIDGDPPYHPFISWPLTDVAKVPAFVNEMSDWGVQTFKIYVGTDRPVGQAVIREAHRRGKWVTAHLAWGYRAQDAVADGIDSLEHIDSVFRYILPPETPEWPAPRNRAGISPADLAALQRRISEVRAGVDLDHPRVKAMIDALLEHKTAVDPTLVVFRNWMLLRDLPEIQNHRDLEFVPARLKAGWLATVRANPLDPATLELRRREFAKLEELTGRLYRAGVELMVGTDTPVQLCPPGLAMHQELELLVESGLPPSAALIAATRHTARALNQSDQLGSISPGKLADIVILDADPLADIRNTRKIHRVIRSGVVSVPAELRRLSETASHQP